MAFGPTALQAITVITGAFDLLGIYAPGQTVDPDDVADAFRRLQNMMSAWATQSLTAPVTAREVFPLVANKGGTTTPYTIGPGGDFNTSKPQDILDAGLLLAGTAPLVEIRRGVATDDSYDAIAIKDLPNALFTTVYYNPTFTAGLGTIFLWPVPNVSGNQIVLYRTAQLGLFTSLTAQYDAPDGYAEAIEYNLAVRLSTPYKRPLNPLVGAMATKSLAAIKRANTKMTDIGIDPAITHDARGGYNIETGQ